LVYSSNENVSTFEFDSPATEVVKFSLLFRASEHGFRGDKFHLLCDEGPTITLVKAMNGRMAAFYNSRSWGIWGSEYEIKNTRGFVASVHEDPEDSEVYFLQKYAANEKAAVWWFPEDPSFGYGVLYLADNCNLNECSSSVISSATGYTRVGMAPKTYLFGEERFGVLEYKVFQVERQ
jgi:hypothetical protein